MYAAILFLHSFGNDVAIPSITISLYPQDRSCIWSGDRIKSTAICTLDSKKFWMERLVPCRGFPYNSCLYRALDLWNREADILYPCFLNSSLRFFSWKWWHRKASKTLRWLLLRGKAWIIMIMLSISSKDESLSTLSLVFWMLLANLTNNWFGLHG